MRAEVRDLNGFGRLGGNLAFVSKTPPEDSKRGLSQSKRCIIVRTHEYGSVGGNLFCATG
jgi:hypothetical protein